MITSPQYVSAMYYTVEIGTDHSFEVNGLNQAVELFNMLKCTRSESGYTLNLVVWSGRSGKDGGAPTGIILDQYSWTREE